MLCAILGVNMCSPEASETTQTCGRGNNHQPSPLDHNSVFTGCTNSGQRKDWDQAASIKQQA
jgi:hypothetical protein